MIKLFKRFAKNKKGSEIIEKILMAVAATALAAIAIGVIAKLINDASEKKVTDDGAGGYTIGD